MLKIRYHSKFKKDYKTIQKRGYDISELTNVIDMLKNEIPLPEEYRDHMLKGKYTGFHECHIKPDWLLIHEINEDIVTLTLTRTGTHSDLF